MIVYANIRTARRVRSRSWDYYRSWPVHCLFSPALVVYARSVDFVYVHIHMCIERCVHVRQSAIKQAAFARRAGEWRRGTVGRRVRRNGESARIFTQPSRREPAADTGRGLRTRKTYDVPVAKLWSPPRLMRDEFTSNLRGRSRAVEKFTGTSPPRAPCPRFSRTKNVCRSGQWIKILDEKTKTMTTR